MAEKDPDVWLWVDAESGTYGSAYNVRIVKVKSSFLDELGEMSDSERGAYAEKHGYTPERDIKLKRG